MTKWSTNFINEFNHWLVSNHSPLIKQKSEAYLRNQFEMAGVKTPLIREWQKNHQLVLLEKMTRETLQEVVSCLYRKQFRENKLLAIGIMRSFLKLLNEKNLDWIVELIKTSSWWDTNDDLAQNILGPILVNSLETLTELARDRDEWVKRCSIIAQNKFKKEVNLQVLEECISNNYQNKWWFMQKAIGWALRSQSISHPLFVQRLVVKFKLSGLAKREALRKIS